MKAFYCVLLTVLNLLFINTLSAQTRISMGISPYTTPLTSNTKQDKFIRYIEEKTDTSITPVVFKNDEELLQYFRQGKIDFAWLGTFQYIKYKTELYSYVIARPIRQNRDYYRGAFITHSSNEISGFNDLRSKSIAFVSHTSQAGYIFPVLSLYTSGLTLGKDYYPEFLRGHDNVIYAVQQKRYDAGVVFDSALEVYLNDTQRSQIKIIGYTRDIPFEPFIISKRIDKELVETIRNAIIECNSPVLLKDLKVDRFVADTDSTYRIYNPSSFKIIDEVKETP